MVQEFQDASAERRDLRGGGRLAHKNEGAKRPRR